MTYTRVPMRVTGSTCKPVGAASVEARTLAKYTNVVEKTIAMVPPDGASSVV